MPGRKLLPALLVLAACNSASAPMALPPAGTYVGLESMGPSPNDITPDDTTGRWYHESTLTIRDDSAFLEQVPVVIYKSREKAYSSSDGGFYSFRGRIQQYQDSLVAHLLLSNHDYVLLPYHLVN